MAGLDDRDLGRVGYVDVERCRPGVEDRPAGSAGDGNVGDGGFGGEVHDRNGVRPRHRRIAHVGGEQQATLGRVGEAVRPAPDLHLDESVFAGGREDSHGVLAAIGGEHQVVRFGHQHPGDSGQTRDRAKVRAGRAVDHVERVVGGVRYVETPSPAVYGRVVEPPGPGVRRELDVPGALEEPLTRSVAYVTVCNKNALAHNPGEPAADTD